MSQTMIGFLIGAPVWAFIGIVFWCICKEGSRKVPSAHEYPDSIHEYGMEIDIKWPDAENTFDLMISSDGDIVAVNPKERMM